MIKSHPSKKKNARQGMTGSPMEKGYNLRMIFIFTRENHCQQPMAGF
jgi:hypothetical protein